MYVSRPTHRAHADARSTLTQLHGGEPARPPPHSTCRARRPERARAHRLPGRAASSPPRSSTLSQGVQPHPDRAPRPRPDANTNGYSAIYDRPLSPRASTPSPSTYPIPFLAELPFRGLASGTSAGSLRAYQRRTHPVAARDRTRAPLAVRGGASAIAAQVDPRPAVRATCARADTRTRWAGRARHSSTQTHCVAARVSTQAAVDTTTDAFVPPCAGDLHRQSVAAGVRDESGPRFVRNC